MRHYRQIDPFAASSSRSGAILNQQRIGGQFWAQTMSRGGKKIDRPEIQTTARGPHFPATVIGGFRHQDEADSRFRIPKFFNDPMNQSPKLTSLSPSATLDFRAILVRQQDSQQ
jgi:hypothetical protein